MDDKAKALANEMMETFQKQGLTCREVEKVLGLLRIRAGEQASAAVDNTPFTAKPFSAGECEEYGKLTYKKGSPVYEATERKD